VSHRRRNLRLLTLRVALIAATVFTALWVASLYSELYWRHGNGVRVGIGRGSGGITRNTYGWGSQFIRGWEFHWVSPQYAAWLPYVYFDSAKQWWCWTPLYIPAGISLTVAALAWRRERRIRRLGLCGACGYSRAGLAAGAVCPECGAAA
jgi:hypothetical protein